MDKKIERRLMNFLYYDLNRLRYFIMDEIFEYDIQASIHKFLMLSLNNKNVLVQREKEGRVDHVITENDENGNTKHLTLIELKSFIKKHERLNIKKIEDDISKLHKRITECIELSSGYLIIAIKEKHLASSKATLKGFIDAINTKNVYSFKIESIIIKTTIIRSRKTSFFKNGKTTIHKDQIRLFAFRIKKI